MDTDDARPVPTLALRGLTVLGMVAAAAVGLVGGFMILDDMSERGDMFHGLGAFLGLLVLGGAVLVLAVLVPLYLLLTRQPRVGLWVTLVMAFLVLVGTASVVTVLVVGNGAVPPWDLAVASGAGALVVAALAAWGLVAPAGRTAARAGDRRVGRS